MQVFKFRWQDLNSGAPFFIKCVPLKGLGVVFFEVLATTAVAGLIADRLPFLLPFHTASAYLSPSSFILS